ncbi:putative FAD-binding domain-containing protein [Seiridium unicorne]|uniref:FAD-binding domain-containing protein n=1 Tax=Seiridium unicorne TaxID=138068 RepID=A0ABR2UMT2_9PEZI
MPLKILINGAGICGPALTIFLLRSDPNHDITVVERSDDLRTTGQQIDIRAQGIPLMRKLGLLKKIRERTVTELGLALVDAKDRTQALLAVNDSGKGQQAFTSEFEIMRGDAVNVLYEESLEVSKKARSEGKGGGVKYQFGKYATELSQDENGVDVVFSDGSTGRYDLVVGCDGQGSRTRRMVWGEEVSQGTFKSLGAYVAFFSIPKDGEQNVGKLFHLPEYRIVFTRTGNRPVSQVCMGTLNVTDELKESVNMTVDEQKMVWKRLYNDCAWQRDRLLDGLDKTDDFYMSHIGQVKMESWSKGRVVLAGDAGYCPSSFTGQGSTASLVGSYILAGELAKHGENITAALESYDKVLRPYIDEMQKLIPGTPNFLYPKTEWGIWGLQTFVWVITSLKIDKAINMLLPEGKGGLVIPEYPELNLPGDQPQ